MDDILEGVRLAIKAVINNAFYFVLHFSSD